MYITQPPPREEPSRIRYRCFLRYPFSCLSPQASRYALYESPAEPLGATSAHHSLRRHGSFHSSGSRQALSHSSHMPASGRVINNRSAIPFRLRLRPRRCNFGSIPFSFLIRLTGGLWVCCSLSTMMRMKDTCAHASSWLRFSYQWPVAAVLMPYREHTDCYISKPSKPLDTVERTYHSLACGNVGIFKHLSHSDPRGRTACPSHLGHRRSPSDTVTCVGAIHAVAMVALVLVVTSPP